MKIAKHAIGPAAACCLFFLLIGLWRPYAFGQDQSLPASNKETAENTPGTTFKIRVSVEEVRIDAVVLDKKGHPITDLTADDFEVTQDYLPRKVLSSVYITNQADSFAQPAIPSKSKKNAAPPLPTPVLSKEKVRRTIVFVLDDVSMTFENLHNGKLCLKNFVEKQMQPGDLVAIIRTSYGNSALQMFLSDKKQLLARIENLRWGANAGFDKSDDNLYSMFDNQLSALDYSIRALKDMPGRKIVLLVTAQSTISKKLYKSADELFAGKDVDYYYMYVKAYNHLADDALRAGVVVHSLDIRGLEAPGENNDYSSFDSRSADGLNPLPVKTGGMTLENSNFFVNGIGDVDNLLKGYYLISYEPPPTTFRANRKDIYHRVRIKVKRRNAATVYTRDGFYGVTDVGEEPELAKNPLREAIFSPFQNRDIRVNLASGYIDDPKTGYLVRSWLYVDAADVRIVDKKDEGSVIDLETVCLTSDINGRIQDSRIVKYLFKVKPENIPWIKSQGIRFSILLPVKKPGSYYVRIAVQDKASGKVGSAYQFVDIPDLKKKSLALSNIFMITRDEDIAWLRSNTSKEISEGSFSPILQKDESRSPALRSYEPGDNFRYMAVLYNSESQKGSSPDVEVQSVLYKDGAELFRSTPKPLVLNGTTNFERIPILQKFTLGSDLKEGAYVLQLIATDKEKKKKEGTASQTMSFEIQPK